MKEAATLLNLRESGLALAGQLVHKKASPHAAVRTCFRSHHQEDHWMQAATLFSGQPRQTGTHISCKNCHAQLRVIRACKEVYLFCDTCGEKFPLTDYTEFLDQLENFISNIPLDRI